MRAHPAGGRAIGCDRTFAEIQVQEQLRIAVRTERSDASGCRAARRFDKHDIGAEIGEQARAILGRDAFSEIDDAKVA